jgi:hypothetical protein
MSLAIPDGMAPRRCIARRLLMANDRRVSGECDAWILIVERLAWRAGMAKCEPESTRIGAGGPTERCTGEANRCPHGRMGKRVPGPKRPAI